MSPQETRTTEPFRREHVEIKEHLVHMSKMIESIASTRDGNAQRLMKALVGALESHIVPHAEWEEKNLYPVIDARAGGGQYQFTATMRHEHRIVGRWIEELKGDADAGADPAAFAHRADQLLGLIYAHFEDEEEVLLPVLDATMTAEEFEREILSKGSAHPK